MTKAVFSLANEFDGDGDALFKACAEQGLEGIVSKHALAPYRSGRSRTWLKTRECFTESTFVVIGTNRTARPERLGLYLLTRKVRASVTPERHSSLLVVRNALGFSLSLSVSPLLGQRLSRHG